MPEQQKRKHEKLGALKVFQLIMDEGEKRHTANTQVLSTFAQNKTSG